MSSRSAGGAAGALLVLLLQPSMAASDGWVMPATAPPVVVEADAFIQSERSGIEAIPSPSNDLVVASVADAGQVVRLGDPVMIFDTAIVEADLPRRRADLVTAKARQRLEMLRLDRSQSEIEEQIAATRADLASLIASRATLDAGSGAVRAQAALDGALLSELVAQRALARLRLRAAAGDATGQALGSGVFAAEEATRSRKRAALAVDIESGGGDRQLRERLSVQIETLKARLGDDLPAGTSSGLAAQLADVRRRRDQIQPSLVAEVENAQRVVHAAERDAHNHTPLYEVVVTPLAGGAPRTFRFASAGDLPAGAVRDDGSPFDGTRGWEADHRPLSATAGMVITGRAMWRAALPDGVYTVSVACGGPEEWDGALVRAAGGAGEDRPVLVANRIPAGERVVRESQVTVRGGMLSLICGDDGPRCLRAPVDGTVTFDRRIHRGRRLNGRMRNVAYVVRSQAVSVVAHMAQETALLLPQAGTLSPVSVRSAQVRLPDGTLIPATVASVGSRAVTALVGPDGWNDETPGNPLDLGFREVVLSLDGHHQGIRLRTAVRVLLTIVPTADWRAVPPWLVAWSGNESFIRRAATAVQRVDARRCGPVTLVRGVPAGTTLLPPGQLTVQEAAVAVGGFAGQVVAGVKQSITTGAAWGRVASLVPDGSDVVAGDEILALYSPWIEEHRDDLNKQLIDADRAFANALASRQERQATRAMARRDERNAERLARLDLERAGRIDDQQPLKRADLAGIEAQAEHARSVLAQLQKLRSPPPSELAEAIAAVRRLELAIDRARLDCAATGLGGDWLRVESARSAWEAAADLVDDVQARLLFGRAEDITMYNRARAARDEVRNNLTWLRVFERNRRIRAPATGRLSWYAFAGDQSRQAVTLGRDAAVWQGLAVGEIADLSHLAFTAEVPELRYRAITVGGAAMVRFPGLGGLRVRGTVRSLGQALSPPRDVRDEDPGAPITDQRVFSVTLDLDLTSIPAADRGRIAPGQRGILELAP